MKWELRANWPTNRINNLLVTNQDKTLFALASFVNVTRQHGILEYNYSIEINSPLQWPEVAYWLDLDEIGDAEKQH